jgi:signal transduction histidine kinase
VQLGFTDPDPAIWSRIAERHGIAVLVEPAGAPAAAWDETGRPIDPAVLAAREAAIRGVRTGADGSRATLFWTVSSFGVTHLTMLGAFAILLVGVVGTAFWFLGRQLRPLAALQEGVEALSAGDLEARVAVVRDDEIGRVATAFNDMVSRVGDMIRDRERLLADVSHELRSPIARMKVALELLPESAKREALARDLREMERMTAVILERERLRSRSGTLERRELDLTALVREAVMVLADQGPGVELAGDGAVRVHGDPALLKLLVHNLVDNAVKFSAPGSRPVVVRVDADDHSAWIEVADDGIGIPDDVGPLLFEPFVKLDRARGHHVGYGLGLDLCQRVVELHGGAIELTSKAPRGTLARVTLPRDGQPGGAMRRSG